MDDTEVNTKAASEVGYSVITLRNPEDLAAGISEIIGAGL